MLASVCLQRLNVSTFQEGAHIKTSLTVEIKEMLTDSRKSSKEGKTCADEDWLLPSAVSETFSL